MAAAYSLTKPIYDSSNANTFAYASQLVSYPDGYGNPIWNIGTAVPPYLTHCGRLVGVQNVTQSYTFSRSNNGLSKILLKTTSRKLRTTIWAGKNFDSSDWNYTYDYNKIYVRIRISPNYTLDWQTLNIANTYKGEAFVPTVDKIVTTWTHPSSVWQINPSDKIILDIYCGNLTGASTSFWFSSVYIEVDHRDYYPITINEDYGWSYLTASGEAKAEKKYYFYNPTGDLVQSSSNAFLRISVNITASGGISLSGVSRIRRRWEGQGGISLASNNYISRGYIPVNVSIHVDEKKKLLAWWPLDYNPQNPFFAEDIQKNLYVEIPKSKITRFLWTATSIYDKVNYINFMGPVDPLQVSNSIFENNSLTESSWLNVLEYNFFENDSNNYIKFKNSVYGNLPPVQGDGFTRLKTIFLDKHAANIFGIPPAGPTTEYFIRHESKVEEATNNLRFKIIGRYYNSSSFVFAPGDKLIFIMDKTYSFTYQTNNKFKFDFDMSDFSLYLAATAGFSTSADLSLFTISNYLNTSFLPMFKIIGGQPKTIHGLLENDIPSYDVSGNMNNTYLLQDTFLIVKDYKLYFKNAPFDYNSDFNYNGFTLTINKLGNQNRISLSGTNNEFNIQFNGTFIELELCYDSDLDFPRPDLTIKDIDLFVPGNATVSVNTHGYLTNMSSGNWSEDVPNVLKKTKGKLGYNNFNQYSIEFNNTDPNSITPQFISFDIEGQSKIFNIGTDDFSVCCWVKPAIVQNSDISAIVTKILLDSRGWAITLVNIDPGGTNDYIVLGIAKFNASEEVDGAIVAGPIINDNKWHHITMTKSSTHLSLYVDGIDYGSFDHTTISLNNTLALDQPDIVFRIADVSGTNNSNLNYIGKIDDVRIYKKVLSGKEALDLYEAGDITTALVLSPHKKYTSSLNPIPVSGQAKVGLFYQMFGDVLLNGSSKIGIRINGSGECLVQGVSILIVRRKYIIRNQISSISGLGLITKRGIISVGGTKSSGIALVKLGYMAFSKEGVIASGNAPHRKEIFGDSSTPAKRSHNPEGGVSLSGSGIYFYQRKFKVITGSVEKIKKQCGNGLNVNFNNINWLNPDGISSAGFIGSAAQDTGRFINYKQTNYLRAMNFNFNIPTNSILIGIELEIEKLLATILPFDILSNIRFNEISLVIDNNKFNSNFSYSTNIIQDVLQNYTFGGSNTLWNSNLSLNQINNVNFGFSIQIEYKTTYEVQTNIFIDNVFANVYFIKPIKVEGLCFITNRMVNSVSLPIIVKGLTIPKVIRNVIYPKINLEVEGESIVRLPFPARHYGNGSMKVTGSAKINFIAKAQAEISIGGSADSVRVYPFVTGKKGVNWHDEFERIDNYDIG